MPSITIDQIASSEGLTGLKLSADGQKVLYHVYPLYKTSEHSTSAIWTADTDKPETATQLTSGLCNDTEGQFHPDGDRVVFLSDRHKAGDSEQLYIIKLTGGEALPLIKSETRKKKVSAFSLSPNGLHVAFTSEDEPTAEEERKEKEKDDKMVFMDGKNRERLRLYSFDSETVRSLSTPADKHVENFVWSPDSKELLYRLTDYPEREFTVQETPQEKISIALGAKPQRIGSYAICPMGPTLWTPSGDLTELRGYMETSLTTSLSVYTHHLASFARATKTYGACEDAASIVNLSYGGQVAVEVTHGLDSRIEVVELGKHVCTLFDTHNDAIRSGLWDAKRLEDGSYVLALFKSSANRGEPLNVWVGRGRPGEGKRLELSRLSDHFKWLKEVKPPLSDAYEWTAKDGTKLNGVIVYPPGYDSASAPSKPLPTVLLIHGGPYYRDTLEYQIGFIAWQYILAQAGYLVLRPNYRGSSGRGHEFAHALAGNVGTLDWSDCDSMVNHAVSNGLADPKRLGIGGWSQGGFLTAWGVSQTKDKFKAGVMGAGISDWGSQAAESDIPQWDVDMGGTGPWSPGERTDLKGSPIRFVHGVETAVLILHGEKDPRVPTTQGITYMRGLRKESKYPDRHQMVIYPREQHIFKEKAHCVDVIKRVLDHFNAWL